MAKDLNKQPLDFEAMIRGGADLWRDYDAHLDAMEELVTQAADDPVALREMARSTLYFVRDERRLLRRYLRARPVGPEWGRQTS